MNILNINTKLEKKARIEKFLGDLNQTLLEKIDYELEDRYLIILKDILLKFSDKDELQEICNIKLEHDFYNLLAVTISHEGTCVEVKVEQGNQYSKAEILSHCYFTLVGLEFMNTEIYSFLSDKITFCIDQEIEKFTTSFIDFLISIKGPH
ncbi:MAG: hypothetical protein GY828_07280 [Candidatus Gracilibacteria bacterium]|nr:hypothetical protein [Candidatus Gracilibacteria bacterium]